MLRMKEDPKNKRKTWTHLSISFHVDGRNNLHKILVHHRGWGRDRFVSRLSTSRNYKQFRHRPLGAVFTEALSLVSLFPWFLRLPVSGDGGLLGIRLFKRSCTKIDDNPSLFLKKKIIYHLTNPAKVRSIWRNTARTRRFAQKVCLSVKATSCAINLGRSPEKCSFWNTKRLRWSAMDKLEL